MAVFKSKYLGHSFYVGGKLYSFTDGSFSTDDPEVIKAVSKLDGVQRVDEADKADKPTKQEEPKAEVKQDKQEPKKDKSKASAK